MIKYIVYSKETGEILRSGGCSERNLARQIKSDKEAMLIGFNINSLTQKVIFDVVSEEGTPINPRLVDKEPNERTSSSPTIPPNKQPAHITEEDWSE